MSVVAQALTRGRTSRRIFGTGVAATALALALPAASAGAQAPAQAQRDIVDTAVAAGQFTTLARALQAAGLVETLKGPGPFTVFAPTDAAFAKVPSDLLNSLLANQEQLRAVLTYHVVAGRVLAADVVRLTTARTVQGENVRITTSGGAVRINDANVVTADVLASNGVIHVVDTVLLPPSIASTLPRTGGASFTGVPVALAVAGLAVAGYGLRSRLAPKAVPAA
jgi:uncharacterized surface protein with fasciclin (FAS1) repeats